MKKDHKGKKCHRKDCAVALCTDSPPITFPRNHRWGWSRGGKRAGGQEVLPAAQGDLSKDVHRVCISCLRFSTVCPTHTQGSLMDFSLPASPILDWDVSKDDWPQDCSSWDPGGCESQCTQKPRSHLIGHLRPQVPDLQIESIFPAEWPQSTGTWHVAQSQVTESIPFSASIKTQEFLQPEPAALLCHFLTLTSLHSKPEVDDGGGPQCHVIIISTDLVRSPVLCGITGSWVSYAPPDITGAVWSSLSRVWSASLTGESWEPGSWTTWSPTPHCPGQGQLGQCIWA